MSTCGPGNSARDSRKDIPELFFVATAIKACYGELPDWEESGAGYHGDQKRPRPGSPSPARSRDAIDTQFRQLYCELRNKALSDVKALVRERVEKLSTVADSYDFMNMYGMCSFDTPNVARVSHRRAEPLLCKFTKLTCPEENSNSNSPALLSVSGILNPILSARVEHGELELTRCKDSDYHRAAEEFTRLYSRSRMRVPKVCKGGLGSTLGSMESPFIFTVREDLHVLGRSYGQILVTIELLHLSMLHMIYS